MGNALLSADAPLYDDWKSKNTRLGKDGIWVFEGDILIGDEDVLRAIYLERFHKKAPDLVDQRFRSIAACEGPHDRKWSVGEKLDLTYCIGRFETFGLRADPEESEVKCVEYCSEELRMRADEHSQTCAVAYEQMMICVGTLETCDEYYDWGGRESNDLCKPESEIFDRDCEGY